jgi:hypothetical protein
MKLFYYPDARWIPADHVNYIDTSLGSVRLTAILNGIAIDPPTEAYALDAGARLVCWHTDAYDLELLLCKPPVELWPDLETPEYVAAFWRMQAKEVAVQPIFVAEWVPGWKWSDRGPDSGQFVYAWEWTGPSSAVNVGAEDVEHLLKRCLAGDEIPAEWRDELKVLIDYHHRGAVGPHPFRTVAERALGTAIALPVPELAPDARCRIQFAVAWTAYADDSMSRNLTVDVLVTGNLSSAAKLDFSALDHD